jgi:hypothetical protein
MRPFRLFLGLLLMSTVIFAQQPFEGLLIYEQELAGVKSELEVWVGKREAHLIRKEANELHYWLNEQGELKAWVAGKTRISKTRISQADDVVVKVGKQKRLMSGYEATSFEFVDANGAKLEGWYTPAVDFEHNRFIFPIQGHWWGKLPGKGLLLEWQYTDAKGHTQLKGKLLDVQAGRRDANVFELPAGARMAD